MEINNVQNISKFFYEIIAPIYYCYSYDKTYTDETEEDIEAELPFKIFGVFYLGAVIIMTVIAIHLAIVTGNTHDIVYAIGAVLFTASDIVLIFNTFSGTTKFSLRITNLSLYYVGQLLIAGSLFVLR